KARRYDVDFSTAVIACAGAMAQIIPPSLTMVVIAIIGNISIVALFIAGIVPGFLCIFLMLFASYLFARKGGPQYRASKPFSMVELLQTGYAAMPAFGMPLVIVGGIIGGVFTPTEAAGVAGFYGVLVSLFVYREL